jgi:hypothetical protein
VPEKYILSYLDFHRRVLDQVKPGMEKEEFQPILDSLLADWKKRDNKGERMIKMMAKQFPDASENEAFMLLYSSFLQPWWQYFLQYDPRSDIARLKCEALVLNGSRDVQVQAGPNLELARKTFPQPGTEILEMEGLNHLFQHCKTCSLGEYTTLEETIAPEVLDQMLNWLRNASLQ